MFIITCVIIKHNNWYKIRLARCGHISFFFHRCHWSNEYSSSFADTINVTRQLSVELQLSSDGSRVGDTQRAGDKFDLLFNMYFYVQHEPTCTKISRPTTCTLYMYINCQICARWLSNSPEMAYIYYTQNSFMLSPCPARFGLVFQSGEQMCVRRPMLYIFLCQSFTDKNSHGRQTGDCHPTRSLSMYDCR